MRERHFKILIIFVVLSGVLVNYQNCGSSANMAQTEEVLDPSAKDRSVINPINIGGISFIQSKAVVSADDQELAAYGTCAEAQSGARLSWSVEDDSGAEVASGHATCNAGAFEVLFQGLDNLACGTELTLVAKLGAKASTQLLIDKDCQ